MLLWAIAKCLGFALVGMPSDSLVPLNSLPFTVRVPKAPFD